MCDSANTIRTLDDLRLFVHGTLCDKENLLRDQFEMTEMKLMRRGRDCGIQFCLQGPRSVRLGAIWASDQNTIFFYDARGQRYQKSTLKHRLHLSADEAADLTAA